MSATFGRGAHTVNSMFFKPMMRKNYHRKKNSGETMRETVKVENEEQARHQNGKNGKRISWVPHETTGIFYPKGQEKVMQDIPLRAAKDSDVNWFSN